MAVDGINRGSQAAGSVKKVLIGLPIAAPFFVIVDAVQEFLLRYLPVHPHIEDFLVSRENGLDGKRDITLPLDNFLEQGCNKVLTGGKRVVVADPDEVRLTCLRQNFVVSANRFKRLEFFIKLLDIFPRRGGMNFPDVRLNSTDSLPL